jgi:hypothetical protein
MWTAYGIVEIAYQRHSSISFDIKVFMATLNNSKEWRVHKNTGLVAVLSQSLLGSMLQGSTLSF